MKLTNDLIIEENGSMVIVKAGTVISELTKDEYRADLLQKRSRENNPVKYSLDDFDYNAKLFSVALEKANVEEGHEPGEPTEEPSMDGPGEPGYPSANTYQITIPTNAKITTVDEKEAFHDAVVDSYELIKEKFVDDNGVSPAIVDAEVFRNDNGFYDVAISIESYIMGEYDMEWDNAPSDAKLSFQKNKPSRKFKGHNSLQARRDSVQKKSQAKKLADKEAGIDDDFDFSF